MGFFSYNVSFFVSYFTFSILSSNIERRREYFRGLVRYFLSKSISRKNLILLYLFFQYKKTKIIQPRNYLLVALFDDISLAASIMKGIVVTSYGLYQRKTSWPLFVKATTAS